MNTPELQWRNNDPSENIQVDFTDAHGDAQVLSFVATRPHWCEEPIIYGDLFAAPLEKIFDGEVDPVLVGTSEEAHLLDRFRETVLCVVKDMDRCRDILSRRLHVGRWEPGLGHELSLVWFLDALESRSKRYAQARSDPRA